MDNKFVSIKPFEQVKTTVVTSMTVRVMRVELFKSATLHVTLMDSRRSIVDSKVVEINGDDYKQWGGDDNFIYQYIASKFGFSIPEEVTPLPPASLVTVPVSEEPAFEPTSLIIVQASEETSQVSEPASQETTQVSEEPASQ